MSSGAKTRGDSADSPRPPRPADAPQGPFVVVPMSVLIEHSRRAIAAERQVKDLKCELGLLHKRLEARSDELAAAEAQRDEMLDRLNVAENRILAQRMLAEVGVVDLETGSALLSSRVDLAEDLDRPRLARHVERLVLDRPFLRRGPAPSAPPAAGLPEAAERVMLTGRAGDVAEYLLLRQRLADPSRGGKS